MPRRIFDARVKFLSLCPEGMTGLRAIYKAKDGSFRLDGLAKMGERGELTVAVYVPGHVDGEDEQMDAEEIRKAAYGFMRDGKGVDMLHDEEALPKEAAFVAESFIIQKGDPRFADLLDAEGKRVDATGGWGAVIKLENPSLRKWYREGEWRGISMGGEARRENAQLSKIKGGVASLHFDREVFQTPGRASRWAKRNGFDGSTIKELTRSFRIRQPGAKELSTEHTVVELAPGVKARVAPRLPKETPPSEPSTTPMPKPITDENLGEALKPHLDAAVTSITKAVKDALDPNAGKTAPLAKSTITLDPNDPKSVEQAEAAVRMAKSAHLATTLDLTDEAAVAKHLEGLKKGKGGASAESEELAGLRKQQAELNARIDRMAKASTQTPGSGGSDSEKPKDTGADADPILFGTRLGKSINEKTGRKFAIHGGSN